MVTIVVLSWSLMLQEIVDKCSWCGHNCGCIVVAAATSKTFEVGAEIAVADHFSKPCIVTVCCFFLSLMQCVLNQRHSFIPLIDTNKQRKEEMNVFLRIYSWYCPWELKRSSWCMSSMNKNQLFFCNFGAFTEFCLVSEDWQMQLRV